MKTKYRMQVFADHHDYQQLIETKFFNTFSLAKRYMSALRAQYEDEDFVCEVYKNA